jgi:hypothetical protein
MTSVSQKLVWRKVDRFVVERVVERDVQIVLERVVDRDVETVIERIRKLSKCRENDIRKGKQHWSGSNAVRLLFSRQLFRIVSR